MMAVDLMCMFSRAVRVAVNEPKGLLSVEHARHFIIIHIHDLLRIGAA